MHLGNGAITPECAVLGMAVAGAGLGYGCWAASRQRQPFESVSGRNLIVKAAALGAFVFAAQMINLPVLTTSSAHFVGGVLLAELLGPALGALTMGAVLLVQAVLLGDGGLMALGVNVTTMGLVPAGLVALLKRFIDNQPSRAAAGSAVSIIVAVVLISGSVALGRSAEELAAWPQFAASLAVAHLPVLALEAAFTVGLVKLWNRSGSIDVRCAWQLPAAAAAAAALLIALAGSISSDLPDGYESAAESAMPSLLDD